MSTDFVQNINPLWGKLGPFGFRYYTVCFVAALILGYVLWLWQMSRGGHPVKITRKLIWLGIPATVLGARLGHVLFYTPPSADLSIGYVLRFWKGGLASHGALVALLLSLILLARIYRIPYLEVTDRFTFSSACGAALVRLGNFFNSEVVGQETTLPFGVRFIRYDAGSKLRHPSQLYEMALALLVLGLLFLADWKLGKERRPRGLLTGIFLTGYFGGRLLVELTKAPMGMARDSGLTMGQMLSLPPFLAGVALLIWVWRRGATDR